MAGTTLDLEHVLGADRIAVEIALQWDNWNSLRSKWVEEKKELRNYLYATDTTTTSNKKLPWSNSTTTPKLTQIKDNLHANYFAALFPQQVWMRWYGEDETSDTKFKKETIQSYMQNKVDQSGFVDTCSILLDDYIQYGNCFGYVAFERGYLTKETGEVITSYIGPRLTRVSPFDIVFNPQAATFEKTPKIIRSVVTLGELKRMSDEGEDVDGVFNRAMSNRKAVLDSSDLSKSSGFIADGFSDIKQYYGSDYVEILTFFGDIYDKNTDTLMSDRIIKVVDRAYILSNVENPSWYGTAPLFKAGWRDRPDNLYSMGPLDNLVGMQYRIDHLENLASDVFDQIALPMLKIRGNVEDFTQQPGERIYVGEEGDVSYLHPDTTALNADFKIDVLQNRMEEMAGAPRQAMGIRTPGEKTAFEVQTLQNSAGRIFQHKTSHFERVFIEPILNTMLEVSRRNMDQEEVIRIDDSSSGTTIFDTITKDDILGKGKIRPLGARHFAERAQRVQNLSQMWQVKQTDPTVAAHLSGKMFAQIMADELGEPGLFQENVAVEEQMQTQRMVTEGQVSAEGDQQIAMENGL
jgi:hypothetical protein